MSDLRGFGRRMNVRGDNVVTNTRQLVKKVGVQVDAALVLATPVDTGRARLNWQVEIDAEPQDTLPEPPDPASGARTSLENAKQTIATFQLGSTIHIVNNLDYIGRLNEGWSAQAPANFVEEAISVGIAAVKGAGPLTDVQQSTDLT